jgi:hypothetical protein
MPEGLKLDELEQYRQEKLNAEREGRPCKYRNPREVFAEDPNLDSYLVERDEDEINEEQEVLDRQKSGETTPARFLADPGQEVAEALALEDVANIPTHQNMVPTPNPENGLTGAVDEPEEDVAGLDRDYTDEEKRDSALTGPDIDSPNHPTPIGAVTTQNSGHEDELEGVSKPQDEVPVLPVGEQTQDPSALNDPDNSDQQETTKTTTRPDLDTI